MNKKNILYAFLLVIISAVIIFFKLGSDVAPETVLSMKSEEHHNEIILNFDKEYEFRNMYIFLGRLQKRQVSIFYANHESKEWQLLCDNAEIKSVFFWNEVKLPINAYSICLVGKDEELCINEIVLCGTDGYTKIPYNYTQYPELFDEQGKIPKLMTYYDVTMFDEVYYARTAFEMIHGYRIYEWTHPPLGKILMTIGIRLFGCTPFGWRFISAVLGTLMVPLFYAFMWELTENSEISLMCGIVLISSFMHETLSRICTIDIIVAFFVMLAFYFMFRFLRLFREDTLLARQYIMLLFSGISIGLAIATKWTGVYGGMGLALIILGHFVIWAVKKKFNFAIRIGLAKYFVVCMVSFIFIPIIIYVLSYIPFLKIETGGRSLIKITMDNAVAILNYHKQVFATHPYSSKWYTWLIDYKPLLDSAKWNGDTKYSIVTTFGNPIILYGGLVAICYNIFLIIKKRDYKAVFLMVGYLSMLLPWVMVTRTVFIYQYFISILFLIMMIIYDLSTLKNARVLLISFTTLSCIAFTIYYPIITGALAVDYNYVKKYLELLPGWGFC